MQRLYNNIFMIFFSVATFVCEIGIR